ncbi:MAG: hypothetical protein ISS80_01730 [Candidatus Cloacimonetes bacterium]|nr:hypothetical protein [Candidatus Cloacimonadota bacterium]MBL7148771.1 hypothetical protein [Candidatus Cloacimonadota bacterium]
MKRIFLLTSIVILLMSCTGEENLGVDSTPPEPPELIPHLGDTGDGGDEFIFGANYYNTNDPELEYNGIDAVPGGNQMQIQWRNITDSDIDYLNIYRFSMQDYVFAIDTLNFATMIDSVDYDNQSVYQDVTAPVDYNLFYFIKAVDEAGNSTLSDTVGYKLIYKPSLLQPSYNESFTNASNIIFKWAGDTGLMYRLLVFDIDRNPLWQWSPLGFEPLETQYGGPVITPPVTLIWRVDVFGQSGVLYTIEGNDYYIDSGAESEERYIYITE